MRGEQHNCRQANTSIYRSLLKTTSLPPHCIWSSACAISSFILYLQSPVFLSCPCLLAMLCWCQLLAVLAQSTFFVVLSLNILMPHEFQMSQPFFISYRYKASIIFLCSVLTWLYLELQLQLRGPSDPSSLGQMLTFCVVRSNLNDPMISASGILCFCCC